MIKKFQRDLRNLLNQEEGTIYKSSEGKIRICLVYPNSYYIGMSNLGFQSVYNLFNQIPDCFCERAFLPKQEYIEEFRRSGIPLFSLESQTPLYHFDIIAFSLSYENDYPNVLLILDLARIPLLKKERNEKHPLTIGGGVAVTLNPEPLADFLDLFVLGESEEVISEFIERFQNLGEKDRETQLKEFSSIEGIYIPSLYEVRYKDNGLMERRVPLEESVPEVVKRRWINKVDNHITCSQILTPNTDFGDTFLVEVNRGCPWGCRFCAAGFIYLPYRKRGIESLKHTIMPLLMDKKKIGLLGTAVSDYLELDELCSFIVNHGCKVSLASLRMNSFNPQVIRCLKESGHRTVALAPETGSERLRKVIKKGLTDEEIFEAIRILVEQQIPCLKLYFMVGLPTEKDEDIQSIIDLTKKIKHIIMKEGRGGRYLERITLSINPFVPKPHTPFQWVAMEEISVLKSKLRKIQKGLQKEEKIIVTYEIPKWSYTQALFSRGDQRVGKILLALSKCGYNWSSVLREVDINADFYVYRERGKDEVFPWDFIDIGISKEYLWNEYVRAIKN